MATDDPTLERLRRELVEGRARLPAAFRDIGKATAPLRAPLSRLPGNAVVVVSIEVPDNRGGRQARYAWVPDNPDGLNAQDARHAIIEQLFMRFLDVVLPPLR